MAVLLPRASALTLAAIADGSPGDADPKPGTNRHRCERRVPPVAGASELYCPVAALNLATSSTGMAAAVLDLDTLRLAPLTDLGTIHPARRRSTSAPGRPPLTAADPPPYLHVPGQRIPQLLGMFGVQIDLICAAIQPEADRTLGVAAVEVVDKKGLHLLCHRSSTS
jgi:hypothetical protein